MAITPEQQAKIDADEPVDVPLSKPFKLKSVDQRGELEEREITFVTVRPPLGEDLYATDKAKGEAQKAGRLIAQLTELSFGQAGRLPARDFAAIGEICAAFLPAGEATGGTS